MSDVFEYLDIFPGKLLEDMMRPTTLMRYEVAARYQVDRIALTIKTQTRLCFLWPKTKLLVASGLQISPSVM